MTTFVKSSSVKKKRGKINKKQVDAFIDRFNKFIKKDGRFGNADDKSTYGLNDCLDELPTLNNSEFELAVKLAKEQGWKLTQHPDNYQTTSYHMTKIK